MVPSLFVFLALAVPSVAQTNEPKQVLILLQEDLSWPIFRSIDENVRATLKRGTPDGILIFGEHLDRSHFPDSEIQAEQLDWIRKKYASSRLDLILAVGDVPTDLFPGVPIVKLSGDPRRLLPALPKQAKGVSSVWFSVDAQKTLEEACRLQTSARQIVVIGEGSPSDDSILNRLQRTYPTGIGNLPIRYVKNPAVPDIFQEVSHLAADTIVLFTSLTRDQHGHPLISAEVAGKIAASSGAPVYAVFDTHIGTGAVGGYVVSFADVGKSAGQLGLRILAGERPEDVTVPSLYLFDGRQLRRWKISESVLPAGSVIINRQLNPWQSYKWFILGAISLFLAETVLILRLLSHRARRRKVEASLAVSLAFEHLLSDLSTTLINLPESQIIPTIKNSLGPIAHFLRIERITIHEYSRELSELSPTITWREQDNEPAPVTVKLEQFPWWMNLLGRGESVFVSSKADLPEAASLEKEYLQRIHAVSIATIPLNAGNEILGCISFMSTRRTVAWTNELKTQLKLVGEIVSNALQRKRAREAQSRHDLIVESSDDAIISKNLDGMILSWNSGAERLFGYAAAEALGKSIRLIIPGDLQAEEDGILERTRAGERIEHYETARITKLGKKIDVSLTISPLRDSSGVIVGSSKIARDITERKRAVQNLRESEERFRLMANTAPVLIWMAGTDKLCSFFNQSWLNFTGRPLVQELGTGWASGVHPDDLERCLRTYSSAFDSRREFEMEYRLRRFDGVYRWIVDLGVPRFERDGTFCGYVGSCVDITERRTSEDSLHQLSGRLIRAQEEERSRIARELHDDFSQRLALLSIGLGQLWKKLPESGTNERSSILEMLKGLKEISTDIHSLSHELHSSKLEHVGLVPALQGLCREFGEKHQIAIEFQDRGLPPNLSKDIALCMFRVAQESLGNVVKHSDAKDARVELGWENHAIYLRISDFGRGFDPDTTNKATGIGLVGMSERLRLVGGRLSVNSLPGKGTEVFAEVPVAMSANEIPLLSQATGA